MTSYADPGNLTSSVNEDIKSSLLQQLANKVFTTTETGSMGIALPVVQADDIVFVLLRGRFPVVLRSAEGETDTTSAGPDVQSRLCSRLDEWGSPETAGGRSFLLGITAGHDHEQSRWWLAFRSGAVDDHGVERVCCGVNSFVHHLLIATNYDKLL